jgi:hypothetical protein
MMSPVYELKVSVERLPGGKLQTKYAAAPVLFLESIRQLPVRAGSVLIPIVSLDPHDQSMLAAALAEAEGLAANMRRAKGGIVRPDGAPARLALVPGGKQ